MIQPRPSFSKSHFQADTIEYENRLTNPGGTTLFQLSFASSAFLRCLRWGPWQRPLARWFQPQLWLAYFNLSANASGRFSARPNFKWTNSELWMKPPCERPLSRTPSQAPQESRRGKFWGKFFVLHDSFDRRSTGGLEWNLLGFMELLVLLRFGTFPFEEKAICGATSG